MPSPQTSFKSYYLDNLINERTHGVGKAISKRDEDLVELELEVASESSSSSESSQTAPATITRSRTFSVSQSIKLAYN